MFRGITAISLDAKGRIAIPTRYRGLLCAEQHEAEISQVVLTIDTDAPCLLLYPVEEWETIERKIAALPSFNQTARRIQRLLIGHATEVELDSHGRLLIPGLLRDYAGLQKEAMLVGQGRKFEIWATDRWQIARDEWLASDLSNTDEMPNELKHLSL